MKHINLAINILGIYFISLCNAWALTIFAWFLPVFTCRLHKTYQILPPAAYFNMPFAGFLPQILLYPALFLLLFLRHFLNRVNVYMSKLLFTRLIYAFLLITACTWVNAQGKFTVSGYVKDTANGENLMAASVYVVEISKGVNTNEYGFYSVTLPAGKYTLRFSYVGYGTKQLVVNLDKDVRLNLELNSKLVEEQEVVITGDKKGENVESTDMGSHEIKIEVAKALPALLGEVDILKTLQLLPGVMASGEGNTGFYVRGGGADQNLVLLDNATVYNTGHLLGFFSVFNSDAVKDMTIIKGGMPAEYGGRISSVLDVTMKDGDMKKWDVEGGIGLIASRLTIQGPIKKNKCSFIVSGRRTYIDLITDPILKHIANGMYAGNAYYFLRY